ncbi:MAG TPA: cytochrome c [Polyangiales bacterium]|nr:cytochrome c [Polyangiales bacterium]
MSDKKPSVIAVLSGVVVGVAVFVGVNVTIGRAIVPTKESLTGPHFSAPIYPKSAAPAVASTGTYQMVCTTCHQAEGQGVPGAFPPLAGSSWLNGDAETPIRIVLLGLSGEVEVNGKKFNAMMPPPPGLGDAQIAEAITFARSNFGNSAGAVDAAMVKRVRASLAGRTQMWTAAELLTLRGAAGGAVPADAPVAAGAAAPAPTEAAPAAAEGKPAP